VWLVTILGCRYDGGYIIDNCVQELMLPTLLIFQRWFSECSPRCHFKAYICLRIICIRIKNRTNHYSCGEMGSAHWEKYKSVCGEKKSSSDEADTIVFTLASPSNVRAARELLKPTCQCQVLMLDTALDLNICFTMINQTIPMVMTKACNLTPMGTSPRTHSHHKVLASNSERLPRHFCHKIFNPSKNLNRTIT
jgi:hypothetical protein